MRALVVDDDAGTRELVAAFLESAGYEILAAEEGEAGLLLARTASPDIVILDRVMPGMDGYEICRTLQQDPGTRHIPVIMLTGDNDPALNQKAYAAGARACVPKPFRREALVAAIQAVVAGRPHAES
jgi:CheY-like chemotaxis protein